MLLGANTKALLKVTRAALQANTGLYEYSGLHLHTAIVFRGLNFYSATVLSAELPFHPQQGVHRQAGWRKSRP